MKPYVWLMVMAWSLPCLGGSLLISEDQPPQTSPEAKIYRDRISPTWLPDESALWYRVEVAPKKEEYIRIEAATGRRSVHKDFKSMNLPGPAEIRTSTLRTSRRKGPEESEISCHLEFKNQLDEPVKLAWVKAEGESIPYAVIAPNASHTQHTYQTHQWIITKQNGDPVATIFAEPATSRILIDGPSGKGPRNSSPKRPRSSAQGFSPDGKWCARGSGNQVILTNGQMQDEVRISPPIPADAKIFGTASWSPNSEAFVFSSAVPVKVRQISIVETSPKDQLQPKVLQLNYAKPGDELDQPVPVLFRLENGSFQPVVLDSTLFANQFTSSPLINFHWSEDGREFYFDFNQRGHQCYRILAVDVMTGQVRPVVEEVSPTFVDYRNLSWRHWLPKTNEVICKSERDGWSHLWKFDVSGQKSPQQLTTGPWVVREIQRVDEASQTIWFTANGLRPEEDPYHLHLCKVSFDGTGFQQLTQGDGTHEIQFSPQSTYFVDTWSRIDHPPVVELRKSADGQLICEMERADATAYLAAGHTFPERFVAKGRDEKTNIYGVIFKPTTFDPAKKYPVLENIYAGPHGAFTPKRFGTARQMQSFADLGFIVVQADGMGTNYRGKAFHDVAWKNLKDSGFPDRIRWIKAAAATRPWMDLTRVGIYGGSAGGQSAMRALLDYSDFYHVAVADCGCHDNRMDKIWWNELWMGWPVDESYAASSNVVDAHKLKGKLLLIVGELDSNVDPASTMQVVAALQKAGKSFDFQPIINANHGAAETPAGSRARKEFLIRHLKPEL